MTTPRALSPLFLIAVGLTVAGCRKPQPEESDLPATAGIQVSSVHAQSTTDSLSLPGRVQSDPDHVVHVFAPLSGRLLNMSLVPGQEVHKGQAIALLQSGDVAQARSDFEKAHIEVIRADAALTRGKILAAHEVLPQAQLQELQAVDDAAHSEQDRARQRVRELGFSETGTSDTTAITAPISGTVLDIGTAAGEMQRSLETTSGIATIANLDTVWVTGDVFEQDLNVVHARDPVEVMFAAYPGQSVHGTIANVGDSLDPSTHAVKVRVVLANPGHKFKPDMFATLRIARPATTHILLPQAAIVHEGSTAEVYVPAGNGTYIQHAVTTGAVIGDKVEVLAGLHEGEQVVTQGAAFLRKPVGD